MRNSGGGGKKDKRKKKGKGRGNGGEREVVTDPRFASVHTDPRFQNIPRKERKVSIDTRFNVMFTDKNFGSSAAPVDKRGRRKEQKENPLSRYYELENEKKDDVESENSEEEEEEEERVKISGVAKKDESEEEEEEEGLEGVWSSDESADMEELSDVEIDTDDDEILIKYSESDTSESEEEVPEIVEDTSRLAAVKLDWQHIRAVDLYVILSSFLPDGGRIHSVTVYPSEFGLERMKEEAVHGPVGLFDDDGKKKAKKKKNDKERGDSDNQKQNEEDGEDEDDSLDESEDDSEDGNANLDENEEQEEEDKDYIAERIRKYEKTKLRYYFAVVCCDSVATANHIHKKCNGMEIMQSSNKLDLRCIPDSMEFKQEARDSATEVPSGYEPSDFITKALQLSKPVLMFDEDAPERAKLKGNFNADELENSELNGFLASDESDSDDGKADAYKSLVLGGGAGEDEDSNTDDDGQEMEVTFNTGLEKFGKEVLRKRKNESESVWDAHLRKGREKKKAKKSRKDSDDESYDNDDGEGTDGFFSGPRLKKQKGDAKTNSARKGSNSAEVDKEARASTAELDLLVTADKGTESSVKGYKIKPEKTKGKKGKEVVDNQILPEVVLDDRFEAFFKDPQYSLDPTDPQFKRSVPFRRQLAERQKKAEQDALRAEDLTKSSNQAQMPNDETGEASKPTPSFNGNAYEMSSLVKSIKMKSKEADRRGKSDIKEVSQSLKKKTKHLLN